MVEIRIVRDVISPELVVSKVRRDAYGAVVTFVGTVRDYSQEKRVLHINYEADEELAQEKIRQIAQEIKTRWQLENMAIYHRIGRVKVGEIALAIALASPHRQEAFAACQYAVDRLNQIVPISKEEVYENGKS